MSNKIIDDMKRHIRIIPCGLHDIELSEEYISGQRIMLTKEQVEASPDWYAAFGTYKSGQTS